MGFTESLPDVGKLRFTVIHTTTVCFLFFFFFSFVAEGLTV